MTRIRHAGTKLVHESRLDPKLKGSHYDFLCGQWCNLEYLDAYEKVEDETPVTCRRCLERMRKKKHGVYTASMREGIDTSFKFTNSRKKKDWKNVNTEVSEISKVFKEGEKK